MDGLATQQQRGKKQQGNRGGSSSNSSSNQPDGSIDLEEWHNFFRYIAEEDTRNAETSPLVRRAAKAGRHTHTLTLTS